MTHTATLHTWPQAAAIIERASEWIRRRVEAGKPVRLTLAEQRRTLPQNSMVHPVVAVIAKKLGRPTDREALRKLRYLLLEQWRFETGRAPMFERSFDGLRWVAVDSGTSDLDKPDCSEFLDWLVAQEAGL